jgi:hypothetical protein
MHNLLLGMGLVLGNHCLLTLIAIRSRQNSFLPHMGSIKILRPSKELRMLHGILAEVRITPRYAVSSLLT